MSQTLGELFTDNTPDTPDSLDTDTVGELQTGMSLVIGDVTAYVLGTWQPPFVLPEVRTVTSEGYRKLVVADDEVAFRDQYDDEKEDWPEDAKVATDDVTIGPVEYDRFLSVVRDTLTVTESRKSPVDPEGKVAQFCGGFRLDGVTVELYRDSGETTGVGDEEKERYAPETVYAYVRSDVDTSSVTVPTRTFTGDDDPITAEGMYRREDSGRYGALCGGNGKKGWYSPKQVAAFASGKVEHDDPHGYVEETYGGRIEWHDKGHNAKVTFVPVDRE